MTASTVPSARARTLLLARVRVGQALPGGGWLPVAGILIHAGLIALVSLVLADALSPALLATLTSADLSHEGSPYGSLIDVDLDWLGTAAV